MTFAPEERYYLYRNGLEIDLPSSPEGTAFPSPQLLALQPPVRRWCGMKTLLVRGAGTQATPGELAPGTGEIFQSSVLPS